MLLRLYEQELLTQLKSVPRRYCYFIAVGAADGYYGIGVLVGSFFEKSWCYEISEQRQDIIRGNAELSNLSDRMSYEEKLKVNFGEDLAQSVLFMDIEGAEFELFHGVLFETLKNSIFLLSYMTGCYLTERSNLTGQDETLITSSKSAR